LFNRFPRADLEWLDLDLSTTKQPVHRIPVEFQIVLIERLIKFNVPVLLCGPSQSGKSVLCKQLWARLDSKQWNVKILHLSSLVDSMTLLRTILQSDLVRIQSNCYTGVEGKSVLFILVGIDRLRETTEDSATELLRAIFERNCVVARANEEIHFSNVHFIGEYTTVANQQFTMNSMGARLQRHWFPLQIENPVG
uniref:Dynein_AAA_lid domain-containing protein n=1 Tax=Anisakis simplex TaxID=6269 RepID=A0A0M3K133_ANISI